MRWFLLSFIVFLSGCVAKSNHANLGLSAWYWHSPYDLSPKLNSSLNEAGIDELFVRAGTLSFDGEAFVPILRQKWRGPSAPRRIHLVFNMDAGAVRHLEDADLNGLAGVIADQARSSGSEAEKTGAQVLGIQLDFDFPTRLLGRYSELLQQVRKRLQPTTRLSITTLPTWFGSSDFADVVHQTDFYVPQFYDGTVAKKVDELGAIANLEDLRRGLKLAESLGHPYRVGIPTYGRALLYNPKGELSGSYQGLGLDEAIRHPALELQARTPLATESQYRFIAVKPGKNGQGKGYWLVYRIPNVDGVDMQIRVVRESVSSNCRGIVLFRIPEQGESMAIPMESLIALHLGKPMGVDGDLRVKRTEEPFARIENPDANLDRQVIELAFRNTGNLRTVAGKEAFSVQIHFEPGAVIELQKGDFDTLKPLRDGMSSSLSRANLIQACRYDLGIDKKVVLGPLLVKAGATIHCEWSAMGENGIRVHGKRDLVASD